MKGFFVPNSVSNSYVANKRDANGSLIYEGQYNDIGLEKQSAIQKLNKNYDTTINNAYSSYLSSRNAIISSNMGQGYKEAYINLQKSLLNQNVIDANTSLESARNEINQNSAELQNQVYDAYKTEVGYFDRLANSLNSYLSYVKNLTRPATEEELNKLSAYNNLKSDTFGQIQLAKMEKNGEDLSYLEDLSTRINGSVVNYLTKEQMNMNVEDLYDTLLNLQAPDYTDAEGNKAMSFIQWLNNNLKDTDTDKTWSQWLFGQGGYKEFVNATKKEGWSIWKI